MLLKNNSREDGLKISSISYDDPILKEEKITF